MTFLNLSMKEAKKLFPLLKMHRQGFTLIELLLSVALIFAVGAIGLPVYQSAQLRNDLILTQETTVQMLRRAQFNSLSGASDGPWGVSVQSASTVLFQGESGVGKEVFARYIHSKSDRSNGSFVKAIVSSFSKEALLEELFGREEDGQIIQGLFDEAQGGTLYLCDIPALDVDAQQALLLVLRDKQYMRIGGQAKIDFQVSLIVSAQHDLRDDVDAGNFSEELYFRVNVVPLVIPPLREHPEDVTELLNFYVDRLIALDGLPYRHFSVAAQNYLRNYHWLGNIRELRNLVQRLLILGTDTEITQEEVEEVLGRSIPIFSQGIEQLPVSLFELPLRQAREQFEHDYLSYQLEQCGGNVSQLAERVQMERTHLYRKMRSLNIDPKQFSK